jgi:hypothetical protein
MRAVRLAGERISVGAGCSLDAWTIAVARFSRGSSAISPAFAHTHLLQESEVVPDMPIVGDATVPDPQQIGGNE